MLPEVALFVRWLKRRSPQASTPIHYASDLKLFFAWLQKPCMDVKVQDIDLFIEASQTKGRCISGIAISPDFTQDKIVSMGCWLTLYFWVCIEIGVKVNQ